MRGRKISANSNLFQQKHRLELQEVKKDLVRAQEEQNRLAKCVREAKRGSEAAEQKAAAQLSKLHHQIQAMKDELEFLKSVRYFPFACKICFEG